jgi:hypothetical protein
MALPRENVIRPAQAVIEFCRYGPDDPGDLTFAFKLMHRCGRQLQALIVLEQPKCLDCGDGLSRSIFENAVTGLWTIPTPAKHAERLVRSFRRELALIAEQGSDFYTKMLERVDSWMDQQYGDHKGKAPPAFEQHLPPGAASHYFRYREVTARTHASVLSAELGSVGTSQTYEQGYLPVSSFITALVAEILNLKSAHPETVRVAQTRQVFADLCDGRL